VIQKIPTIGKGVREQTGRPGLKATPDFCSDSLSIFGSLWGVIEGKMAVFACQFVLQRACARLVLTSPQQVNCIDNVMQPHHDAAMRTTLDLPEDLHRIVTALALHTRSSLSHTAAHLIRRGLEMPASPKEQRGFTLHPVTGLPVVNLIRRITPEDVKALEDE
jgi:hypothetical protein